MGQLGDRLMRQTRQTRLTRLTRAQITEKAAPYMRMLEYMPENEQTAHFRLVFAFSIATWTRHNCRDAKLCVSLANGVIAENDKRVLKNRKRIASTIPGFQRFERLLETHMQWNPAFAVCAACLFLDVWRHVFADEHDTLTTQRHIARYCAMHGFRIE